MSATPGYLKELQKFADANPQWMHLANACIKEWGKGEKQLQHCIAASLKEAHALGLLQKHPNPPKLQSIANDVPRAPRQRVIRAGR